MKNELEKFPDFQRAIMKGHLCSSGTLYQDLDKPIIAVVNSWNEIVPGHAHLRDLAAEVKAGIIAAGGLPLEFNTIAVCDGIAQGHSGMKYSLPSRELITDSIEVMIKGHGIFDGMILLGSCDKIVPAMLMAAARLGIPAMMLTGGPMLNQIKPYQSKTARRQFLAGTIGEKELVDVTLQYYPTQGICPFLGTANTMCIVAEALGMSLPGSATAPALSAERRKISAESGKAIVEMVRKGLKPEMIMTKQAFENAIAVVLSIGGSLNSALHIPAIAHELGIDVSLADFDRISRITPFISAITPNHDEYTVVDLDRAGGIPAVMNEVKALLHEEAITVNGKTVGENLVSVPAPDRSVIKEFNNPLEKEGGIAVLSGNIAPEGALVKSSAVPVGQMVFTGPARVFSSEEECIDSANNGLIKPGDVVIVRGEGPQGGPGMRELHRTTEILTKVGNVAIITDGRYSGASAGLAIGYLSPEAAEGGPIALVEDGDLIEINIPERTLNCLVNASEWSQRIHALLEKKKQDCESNFLKMYGATALSAAKGAVRRNF